MNRVSIAVVGRFLYVAFAAVTAGLAAWAYRHGRPDISASDAFFLGVYYFAPAVVMGDTFSAARGGRLLPVVTALVAVLSYSGLLYALELLFVVHDLHTGSLLKMALAFAILLQLVNYVLCGIRLVIYFASRRRVGAQPDA
jgi:hypothetical protein